MSIRQMILKIKHSLTSASAPTQLKIGELAINIPDKKVWIGDQAGIPSLLYSAFETTNEYSLIQDIRSVGTNGGTSRGKKWNVRALNTISHNSNNNVSLVNDDFILKKGVYSVRVFAPANHVEKHQVRIYNETSSTVEFEGISIKSEKGGISIAIGVIASNGTDLYEVQHYTEEKQEGNGLGDALNIGSQEVYTSVEINKIA